MVSDPIDKLNKPIWKSEATLGNSKKTNELEYDLVVIGSGPAGIHAAVQASKLNKKVCIVEKTPGHIGGCWIHTGTLPSKTLRESLATIQSIRHHVGSHWVERLIGDMQVGKLFHRANKVSSQEESLVFNHLKNNGIDIRYGYGSLETRNSVRIVPPDEDPYVVQSEFVLIGTGSKPRRPPDVPFDGWRVVDSDEILALERVPRSLIVYGAGVVGCEYACIFGSLGIDVTIIDGRTQIMQYMDRDVARELQSSMEELGIKFILGKSLKKIKCNGPLACADLGDESHEAEVLFFAAGRVSVTDRLGLEKLGIERNDRGAIIVNQHFQTKIPNVYAAGDAIGHPALAATSGPQGRHVALHAFKKSNADFPQLFPLGVYTIPELSMIGATEEELKKKGIPFEVGKASYGEVARGYIRGDHHGMLKMLVCKESHQILGIHIVGDDACNLIHIGQVFMMQNAHVQDFIEMIFNYPTLAEAYRIAAFNALNKIFPDGVIKSPPKRTNAVSKKKKTEEAA